MCKPSKLGVEGSNPFGPAHAKGYKSTFLLLFMLVHQLLSEFQELKNEILRCESYLTMHVQRLQNAMTKVIPSQEELRREERAAQRTIERYERYYGLYVLWRRERGYIIDEIGLPATRAACSDYIREIEGLANLILRSS